MISASEASQLIFNSHLFFSPKKIALEESLGFSLSQDIYSDLDQPPFHRVAMDGIAIKKSNLTNGKIFEIVHLAGAGDPQIELPEGMKCIEVMTGAVLPKNADFVIRYEDLIIEGRQATLKSTDHLSANIQYQGSDYKKNDKVLEKGDIITPSIISTLASVGMKNVEIKGHPKVCIISTGNELVDIEENPLPHQIRWSNGLTLKSLLQEFGVDEICMIKIGDDENIIDQTISEKIKHYEIVLLTGGVSAGKFDFVPQILKKNGVQEIFHKVAQRPGKPLWFGHWEKRCLVFGLPGNPVSCLINLRKYVIPLIFNTEPKHKKTTFSVVLDETIHFDKAMTYFCPVKLIVDEGQIKARSIKGNGSGDFYHLRYSDGFVELEANKGPFLKGQKYEFYSWRKLSELY